MKKFILLILVLSLILISFSGCSEKPQEETLPSSTEKTSEDTSLDTQSTDVSSSNDQQESNISADEILDEYYNPHNYMAESDGEYIFYSDVANEGIYKVPVNGSTPEKVLDAKSVFALTLHGDYIYYIDLSVLCRADKDGSNITVLETNVEVKNIIQILCLKDTLYISNILTDDDNMETAYYSVQIDSDPDKLELKEYSQEFSTATSEVFPTARGHYYAAESTSEIHYNLFYKDINSGEKITITELRGGPTFIVTNQSIFFEKEGSIWRSDLDGKNQKAVTKFEDTTMKDGLSFVNYDSEWIYCSTNKMTFRINQTTGKIEEYEKWETHPFDVIGGYMYGYLNVKKVRMHTSTGEIEQLSAE